MLITKLNQHIHKRIAYIVRKLGGCLGYSPEEKRCRIEELHEILKWLEDNKEEN